MRISSQLLSFVLCVGSIANGAAAEKIEVRGQVVDAQTGLRLAARIYVEDADGKFHHVEADGNDASAIRYEKSRPPASVEVHTCVSPHPFRVTLAAGEYTLTVERGKQYVPKSVTLNLGREKPVVEVRVALQRWIDIEKAGWYSGETHVHRLLDELPTAMLADDLNVALPLSYWVTRSGTSPSQGDKNSTPARPRLIRVDKTHVIYPMNTEYEIFTVGGRRHTLGAVFALNHRRPLKLGVPPVGPVARQVRAEGGILELDKHNWPWSMMLVPVMEVDLYELTNNHLWRTEFMFKKFGEMPPEYMKIQRDQDGMTERGWVDFTFQNYYALLNCGFRMRPTGGTASGVHPVPLGFGRVYVYLPNGFSYDDWIKGLNAGRSFVTTGPLLEWTVNEELPGHTFKQAGGRSHRYQLAGELHSLRPLKNIEIIAAGKVVATLDGESVARKNGGFTVRWRHSIDVNESTWIAVRAFEPRDGVRFRFVHSAPVHIDVANRPMRPRRVEVQYFIDRMTAELERHESTLDSAALAEYRQALDVYTKLLKNSRKSD